MKVKARCEQHEVYKNRFTETNQISEFSGEEFQVDKLDYLKNSKTVVIISFHRWHREIRSESVGSIV